MRNPENDPAIDTVKTSRPFTPPMHPHLSQENPSLSTGRIIIDATYLDGDDLIRSIIVIENGVVVEEREWQEDAGNSTGWREENAICLEGLLIPPFVNGHTHMGDAAACREFGEYLSGREGKEPTSLIEDIFKPPSGLKFRLLRALPGEERIEGMVEYLRRLVRCGCGTIYDFREEGVRGVDLLNEAYRRFVEEAEINRSGSIAQCAMKISGAAQPQEPLLSGVPALKILARPEGLRYDPSEIDELLSQPNVIGIGVSGMDDWDMGPLRDLSAHCRGAGKVFALHFSEARRENVDDLISLGPDFVVHAIHATREDFAKLAAAGIGVVFCPRSNSLFGMGRKMRDAIELAVGTGVHFSLGTDNAMLHPPDMFGEMNCALDGMGTKKSPDVSLPECYDESLREYSGGSLRESLYESSCEPLCESSCELLHESPGESLYNPLCESIYCSAFDAIHPTDNCTAKSIKESLRWSMRRGIPAGFTLLGISRRHQPRTKQQFIRSVVCRAMIEDIQAVFI